MTPCPAARITAMRDATLRHESPASTERPDLWPTVQDLTAMTSAPTGRLFASDHTHAMARTSAPVDKPRRPPDAKRRRG
ncbi:MAG: hypothetical protein AAGM22_07690 [Acidobacteriota bacterium]